jgi:hypothetical protein
VTVYFTGIEDANSSSIAGRAIAGPLARFVVADRLAELRTCLVATFPLMCRAAKRLAGGLATRRAQRRVHDWMLRRMCCRSI